MRTDEDTENDELNRLILTLGKRGKESLRWKQHEGKFWNIMFNPSLEIWSKESGTCLVLQPYGSTAEDLKSEEAYDVGDVDIMIFPDSDHLLIHDEMIEYLPAHPLHVRVKGADHPVLKFCCFKDTSYLCSAALKTPHELIYGDLGDTLGVAFDLISRENPTFTLPYTCHLENSGNSPALLFLQMTLNLRPHFSHQKENGRQIRFDSRSKLRIRISVKKLRVTMT